MFDTLMKQLIEVVQKIAMAMCINSKDAAIRMMYQVRALDVEEIPLLGTVDWFVRGLATCVYHEGYELATTTTTMCLPEYEFRE